jgi:hypothetical protein
MSGCASGWEVHVEEAALSRHAGNALRRLPAQDEIPDLNLLDDRISGKTASGR